MRYALLAILLGAALALADDAPAPQDADEVGTAQAQRPTQALDVSR